jgi:hypothetical protein
MSAFGVLLQESQRSSAATTFPAGDPTDRPFTFDLPLSQLEAGRYRLSVKAYDARNERNAATRELTFWITD